MDTPHLWLYAVLVFGIIALPGMDMAFVLASALADGRACGFAATAGIVAGGMAHVTMAVAGIGLLVAHSPAAFDALLLAGSLYVAWMGLGLMRGAQALTQVAAGPSRPLARTFARAAATCLLNPKAYVFSLTVFPQFIAPQAGHLAAQALELGTITAAMQVLVYGFVAQTAASLRARLLANAAAQARFGRAVGALLLAAAALALHSGLRAVSVS